MTRATQSAVIYERDNSGIVVLTMDDPGQSANTMNDLHLRSFADAVDRLYAEVDDVTGVVIASAKKTFFAGGDLKDMMEMRREDAITVFDKIESGKRALRRLELYPRPVVAAINGAALGGGYELALATNRRIAVDGRYDIGLPEVGLGLLPGGGGIARTVRMFGVVKAVSEILLPGTRFRPSKALEMGLVDELVDDREELVPAAKAWISANPDAFAQPWDSDGFKLPGGSPSTPAPASVLPALPATLRRQTKQADLPAPKAILAAAVEGANVDFETALRIESRYFTSLVTGQTAKNMMQAFFFDMQAISSGALRPSGFERWRAEKVGVLGAGMMGAGIAYVFAKAGIEVVLKDVDLEAANRGKAYSARVLDRAIERGKSTPAAKQELLGRITATGEPADLAGCDLVIEAVFEDPKLKNQVMAEIDPYVAPDALLCSNTSTLPISELAAGVSRPADFLGAHFFSPVDKMQLVEIIVGEQTSDRALARAYDMVQQIGKMPIVVNDSRGFYTSRVFRTMISEGLAMLAEGVEPWSIERATTQAGYPTPVLQLVDEANMQLMLQVADVTRAAAERDGSEYTEHPGTLTARIMVGSGRPGRVAAAGFYEYEDGKRVQIWPGLADLFPVASQQPPLRDIRDRMTFAEALETAACLEEGVITSSAAANIGSIFGIGFPAFTGGAAQFMTGYEDRASGETGLPAFLNRADDLADKYGDRFRPSDWLRERCRNGAGLPA